MGKGWWRPEQVAEFLSYSRSTIYRLVNQGELTAFKGSQGLRISRDSVVEFVERHRVKTTEMRLNQDFEGKTAS